MQNPYTQNATYVKNPYTERVQLLDKIILYINSAS